MGTLELSNSPGWGRKKRANAPSSVNTATFSHNFPENDDLANDDLENNDLENDDRDGVARRIKGLEGYRRQEMRGR